METPGRHKLKIVTKIGKGAFGTVYKGEWGMCPAWQGLARTARIPAWAWLR